jgi:UDPglucose--hexose-1-phosphate uridylyltransferase
VGGLEAPEPYDVRWFPNRWPALAPGATIDFADGTTAHPAAGASEVVLFSPAHGESLASLPVEQVRRVVDLWAERTTALLARPEVEYVLVFENRGREVGATIDHPHGQIYGCPRRRRRCSRVTSARCAAISRPNWSRANASSPSTAIGSRGFRSRRVTRTACASRLGATSRRWPRSTTPPATTSRAC